MMEAAPSPSPSPPQQPPPPQDAPRRRRSCLVRAIGSAVDGCILGGALGGIFASGQALQLGLVGGGIFVLRSAARSAISLGGFLSFYNGGTCSLERARGKKDAFNPFAVGGLIGIAGGLPGYLTPMPHAPYLYRNTRALAGAGLSSALLCSALPFLFGGGTPREEAPGAPPVAAPEERVAPPAALPHALESAAGELAPAPAFDESPPSVDPAAGWGIAPSDGAVLAPVAAPAGGGGEALVDKWAAK